MTCYAWGRFWEIGGGIPETRPLLSLGDAWQWWGYNDGYERGQQIELGAVCCYSGGDYSGAGHVAVVEQIFDDYAVVSNSEYSGDFWKLTNISLNGQFPYGHYTFQGFIYNPNGGGKPSGAGKKIWIYKRRLWRIEHEY